MRRMTWIVISLFFIVYFLAGTFQVWSAGEHQPAISVLSTADAVPAGGMFSLIAQYEIPKGIHLTENFLELKVNDLDGFVPGLIQMTRGVFEKGELIRRGTMYMKLPIRVEKKVVPGTYRLKGTASYQVCTDGEPSMCYPPAEKTFEVSVIVTDGGGIRYNTKAHEWDQQFKVETVNKKLSLSERLTRALDQSLMVAFLLVFLGGFLTSLTPCVYPMIPITIGYIGGKSAGQGRSRGFILSLFYVLGLAVVYSFLGILAALTGSLFGSATQTPIVIGGVGIVFFVMGLSMLGLFDITLPPALAGKLQSGGPRKGFLGAVVMGMVAGLVAAPCAGPVILVLLTFIATTGNVLLGFGLMMSFAFGMGILFITLGTFSGLLTSLPQAGAWMDKIKKGFGIVLVLASFWIVRPLLPPPMFGILMGMSAVILGAILGAFDPVGADASWTAKVRRGIGILLLVLGVYWVVSLSPVPGKVLPQKGASGAVQEKGNSIVWETDLDRAMKLAQKEKKRLILDFGADWCAACKELEHKTFNQPEVIGHLKKMIPVKIDATDARDQNVRKLQKKFAVKGLPTVIVLDFRGEEIGRFVSFLPPDQFLEFLSQIDKIEKGE